eukprot:10379625-Prorocentrum_lima.AAC.1
MCIRDRSAGRCLVPLQGFHFSHKLLVQLSLGRIRPSAAQLSTTLMVQLGEGCAISVYHSPSPEHIPAAIIGSPFLPASSYSSVGSA